MFVNATSSHIPTSSHYSYITHIFLLYLNISQQKLYQPMKIKEPNPVLMIYPPARDQGEILTISISPRITNFPQE